MNYKIKNTIKEFINWSYSGFLNNFVLTRSRKLSYENALETKVIKDDTFFNRLIYSLIYYSRILLYYLVFYLIIFSLLQFIASDGELCVDDMATDTMNRFLFVIYTSLYMILGLLIWTKSVDTIYHVTKFIQKIWKTLKIF